jgi:hypothetical protein
MRVKFGLLSIKEDRRLKRFEIRILRRILIPKKDEPVEDCRKLHSVELHNLYSSPDIIRMVKSWRVRWAGHIRQIGEKVNTYRVLVGKPEGKDH